jgi:hypothetical protein
MRNNLRMLLAMYLVFNTLNLLIVQKGFAQWVPADGPCGNTFNARSLLNRALDLGSIY